MVFIISYIKGYYLFFFSFFILYQGKDQTTVFHTILRLKILPATINQCILLYLSTCSHIKQYFIADFIVTYIK